MMDEAARIKHFNAEWNKHPISKTTMSEGDKKAFFHFFVVGCIQGNREAINFYMEAIDSALEKLIQTKEDERNDPITWSEEKEIRKET